MYKKDNRMKKIKGAGLTAPEHYAKRSVTTDLPVSVKILPP
jgi:hypothetical protein